MIRCGVLLVSYLICVRSAFISKELTGNEVSDRTDVRDNYGNEIIEIEYDLDSDNKTSKSYPDLDYVSEAAVERGHSKDMAVSLMYGLLGKMLTLIPMFLTALGLIAGFSLATSKAALLLVSGIASYYYLSENHLLVPLAQQWSHVTPQLTAFNFQRRYIPHVHEPHSHFKIEQTTRT